MNLVQMSTEEGTTRKNERSRRLCTAGCENRCALRSSPLRQTCLHRRRISVPAISSARVGHAQHVVAESECTVELTVAVLSPYSQAFRTWSTSAHPCLSLRRVHSRPCPRHPRLAILHHQCRKLLCFAHVGGHLRQCRPTIDSQNLQTGLIC